MPESGFIEKAERGLYEFREANYTAAQKSFQEAIAIYRTVEEKPVVSFSNLTRFHYDGEGYDKVLLHNYNALSYLMMADLENAMVETRNSNRIQNQEYEKYYRQIRKFKTESEKYAAVMDRYEALFAKVNPKHTPYQNPFAYYISALLFEEANQYEDAIIDIQKALECDSQSPLLKSKLRDYRNKKKKTGRRIELFFDIGKSPAKKQIKMPVKSGDDSKKPLYLPDFTIYTAAVEKIVLVDNRGKKVQEATVLSDIDAIKINEFRVKIPSLTEKYIRESGKELLVNAFSKESAIAGVLAKTASTIYGQNNLYTWRNLPKYIEVISFIPEKETSYKLLLLDRDGKKLDQMKLSIKCHNCLKNCYHYFRVDNAHFITSNMKVKK